jgi:hypothetical protein
MASNKWTQQTPLAGSSIRTVLAERVYFAAADTVFADPTAKLDGGTPAGFTDMGIVAGSKVTLVYTKEVKAVNTGMEQVRRGSYTMAKSAKCSFTLEQYDIDTVAMLTGLTVTAVGAIGGKIQLGQDDIVEKALVFVGTKKVDGKEFYHYSKKASLAWSIDEADDSRVIKVEADLYLFLGTGETVEGFISMIVLD